MDGTGVKFPFFFKTSGPKMKGTDSSLHPCKLVFTTSV